MYFKIDDKKKRREINACTHMHTLHSARCNMKISKILQRYRHCDLLFSSTFTGIASCTQHNVRYM